MRQKGDDVTGSAPNAKRLGPAFAHSVIGFLEVPITVGILLGSEPAFTLTPQTRLSHLKTTVMVGVSL